MSTITANTIPAYYGAAVTINGTPAGDPNGGQPANMPWQAGAAVNTSLAVYDGGDDEEDLYDSFLKMPKFLQHLHLPHFFHPHAEEPTGIMPPVNDAFGGSSIEDFDGFLGIAIGKKGRARKQEKFDAKIYNKRSRGYARIQKADSRKALADKGINMGDAASGIGNALAGLAPVAESLLGGGGGIASALSGGGSEETGSPTTPVFQPTPGGAQVAAQSLVDAGGDDSTDDGSGSDSIPTPSLPKKSNTMVIVAVIAAIAIVVFVVMKKKK